MKLTDDLDDLSSRAKATLFGAMALCCVVPMLVVFGAVSLTGALFGGTALVLAGSVAIVGWGAWMGRHHRRMARQDAEHRGAPAEPDPAQSQDHAR